MSDPDATGSNTTEELGRIVAQRYRLDAFLGKGAMGEVWRATHLGLGSPVALKLIDPTLFAGRERKELATRFEREARAAASLQSNHVVKVTDHGTDERGTPYMAMELLQGESLEARLARDRRLSPATTLTVLTQIGRAMSQAHELGIVHRDLKPENVFIARADGQETVKVLDFGIAKIMRSPLDIATGSTTSGQPMGTPCYMSPEQASGSPGVDHRSDLWAMAVISYECLTGQLPFLSGNFGDLVLSICTRPLPVPSSVAPDLPASFDRWWARAAAREASDRFQSASELCESLREALAEGAFVDSEPPARTELAAAVAPDLERTLVATAGAESPAPTKRSIRVGLFGAAVAIGFLAAGFIAYRFTRNVETHSSAPSANTETAIAHEQTSVEFRPAPAPTPGVAPSESAPTSEASAPETSASAAPMVRPTANAMRPRPASSAPATTTRPAAPPPTPSIDPRLGL